jgi:hypothetical protein
VPSLWTPTRNAQNLGTVPKRHWRRGGILNAVASLDQVLGAPALRGLIWRMGGSRGDPEVRRPVLVEDLEDAGQVEAGDLVVLTHAASRQATDYRLDMALKLAGSRGAAALVLIDGGAQLPSTAERVAERADVVVCGSDGHAELATLLAAVEREIAGDAPTALARIAAAVAALEDAEEEGADADALLEAAAGCVEAPVRLGAPDDTEVSADVVVDGEATTSVCVRTNGTYDRITGTVLAHLAAGAMGRAKTAARRTEDVPIRSRGQLLTEFLLAPHGRGERLLDRMRAAGLTVDGWHVAVRLEIENPTTMVAEDELASAHLTERVGRMVLEQARSLGGVWHLAEVGSAIVLVRMERRDPGPRGARDAARTAAEVLAHLIARMPEALTMCGVGGVHVGAAGLRASFAEARAAVAAARAGRRPNLAVPYDALGLERTLMEWYASDTAREAVDALLAPLQSLPPAKRDVAMHTLRCYLDHEGSLTRAAEELHLHRNAVAYRISRIFEALGVDRDDPDTRLLLQLACRARSLG